MKITRTSQYSGQENTLDLDITQEQLDLWDNGNGPYIQTVFPNLSPNEREFILTGIMSDEWEAMFPPIDENKSDEGLEDNHPVVTDPDIIIGSNITEPKTDNEMIVYKYQNDRPVYYPVGINIGRAIATIDALIPKLYLLIHELFTDKVINVWTRGSSGDILGSLLVDRLLGIKNIDTQMRAINEEDIKIIHIKKPNEKSHGNPINSAFCNHYTFNIIIDDFIATGDTINAIYEELVTCQHKDAKIMLVIGDIDTCAYLDFVPDYMLCRKRNSNKDIFDVVKHLTTKEPRFINI